MKVALVHDYLNQYGGAEKVLETLMEIFPEAPIYTLFYDQERTYSRFRGRVKSTSFLDWGVVRRNHRLFIPLMPSAADSLRLNEKYDLIISSSAGYGKGVDCSGAGFHIAYIHTPLRYAWETDQYFGWHPAVKIAAAPIFSYLRRWDKKAGQKPDVLVANSRYIADKIKKYYQREAEVVYPPVDLKQFYRKPTAERGDYFLAAGRMLPYKQFDLIIQAFNELDLPLVVVGEGPELDNLKKAAKSRKIKFAPFVLENELQDLYSGARALIFPQVEDFGLVAAEAQACGTPVIAFSKGGAREIVEDGVNGIFFHNQTVEDLIGAIKRFSAISFDENAIQKSAERFSKERFKKRILQIIKNAK